MPSMSTSSVPSLPPLALAATSLALLAGTAGAQMAGAPCPSEPTLQHWTGAGNVTCPCFVQGEQAGAIFNAPPAHYPIEILKVGIGWGSQFGGTPQSLESAIKIYGGGLPNPGAPIFTLNGPVLSDGFINEFDLEPLPGQILVNSGSFTVTLEFLNSNAGDIFAPSVVHDGNGCQPGKNVVFAIPGGWFDACALGVTGDWLFHVVYRQVNCGPGGGTYCIAASNSTGAGAMIGHFGSTSITANDLVLTSIQCPPQQLGIFYYGTTQTQIPFGNGFRCVGGSTFRLNPPVQIDLFGNVARAIDYGQPPANSGPGMINAGDRWNFQFWYRDPAAGGASFNFSNGLNLTFVP